MYDLNFKFFKQFMIVIFTHHVNASLNFILIFDDVKFERTNDFSTVDFTNALLFCKSRFINAASIAYHFNFVNFFSQFVLFRATSNQIKTFFLTAACNIVLIFCRVSKR